MLLMWVVVIVVVGAVLGTLWWTARDEPSWQATVRGIAAVSFILLSLGVFAFAWLTAGFTCDDTCGAGRVPPGREWTENSQASEWTLIFYLGASILLLALASVATLRFRRHRAALLFLAAYIVASVQLGQLLGAAHGPDSWSWMAWPTAAGLIMLFAARDRDGLRAVPLRRRVA